MHLALLHQQIYSALAHRAAAAAAVAAAAAAAAAAGAWSSFEAPGMRLK